MKQRKFKFNKITIILSLVLVLALGFTAERVYAYFTTYVTAQGGVKLSLADKTEIHEEYDDWKKVISIENTGEVPVFVRVQIFCGSQFSIEAEGTNWELSSDGYYYYSEVVPVGGTTETITASIIRSADVESSFNIVVVQECTPALYDADGNPYTAQNADWAMAAQYTVETSPEQEGE